MTLCKKTLIGFVAGFSFWRFVAGENPYSLPNHDYIDASCQARVEQDAPAGFVNASNVD